MLRELKGWAVRNRNERAQQRLQADWRRKGVVVAHDSVHISPDSRLAPGSRVSHHASLRSSSLGPYTSIGRFSKLAFVDLGPFCSVAWDTTLGAVGHPTDHLSTHAFPYAPEAGHFVSERDQHVERSAFGGDVWVGTHAVTMPGLTIGAGAMIASGAIVTRDVEPYTVVAGAPARTLKTRFPDDWIARMLQIAWWDWPRELLERHVQEFKRPVDEALLDRLEAIAASRS